MPQIEHVVLVMLENRSFDNVLGWLYSDVNNQPPVNFPAPPSGSRPSYEGLVEKQFANRLSYKGKAWECSVMKGTCGNGLTVPDQDPYEEYDHVCNQLFGSESQRRWPVVGSSPADAVKDKEEARMLGFLQDYSIGWVEEKSGNKVDFPLSTWNQALQIMQTFTPDQLPVLNGLARHYAVSDAWFSSVPTQTNPNRAFSLCGTSLGREKNQTMAATEEFNTDTIFNALDHMGCNWRIYFHEEFPAGSGKCYTQYSFPNIANPQCFRPISQFYDDVKQGLCSFSFLEPSWGYGLNEELKRVFKQGNDYHPPTSVRNGEEFLKSVYDALKADVEKWKKTLLVITFDEHGGTWDHVSPPWGATPPDANVGEHGFKFDRFGVRVPTILVSPWIQAGTVFRSETGVPYDHTSLIATILKWKGMDPKAPNPKRTGSTTPWLLNRVASAPTFENVLSGECRSDTPEVSLPPAEVMTPLTIVNNTPTPICVYLGWGSTEPKPYVKECTGQLNRGQSTAYNTEANPERRMCDYYLSASYWVGDSNQLPGELIDPGYVDLKLDQSWRLLWRDWQFLLHHARVEITQPIPEAEFGPADDRYDSTSKLRIVNQTSTRIYLHLYSKNQLKPIPGIPIEQYLDRGQTYERRGSEDNLGWDYTVNVSYWVGDSDVKANEWIDTTIEIDKTWRLLWESPKKILHNQTLTIRQPLPVVNISPDMNAVLRAAPAKPLSAAATSGGRDQQ